MFRRVNGGFLLYRSGKSQLSHERA